MTRLFGLAIAAMIALSFLPDSAEAGRKKVRIWIQPDGFGFVITKRHRPRYMPDFYYVYVPEGYALPPRMSYGEWKNKRRWGVRTFGGCSPYPGGGC